MLINEDFINPQHVAHIYKRHQGEGTEYCKVIGVTIILSCGHELDYKCGDKISLDIINTINNAINK